MKLPVNYRINNPLELLVVHHTYLLMFLLLAPMDTLKNKFTVKIVLSYLLLVILATIASFYVYSEIKDYVSTETADQNDAKLLKTSSFLTQLYEAESLSKLAIQSKTKKNFLVYAKKIDSIYTDIEKLKTLTRSSQQRSLLDSLHLLLEKKVANNEALRGLKAQNQTRVAISSALKEFDKMEASLGIITPEGLAPNIEELSPKAQAAIRKVADYLNANIPNEDSEGQKVKKIDSVLLASKTLLKEVQEENVISENSLAQREISINKTDLELSQQLRTILSSFEKEMMVNSFNDNIKKEAALKRSIRLALIAALLGFLVVVLFTFIINRDFWKANLYRQKLEKEKKYSESLLKSREQLIATVSHDLRTPLNAISGYTDLIEESGVSKKQEKYVTYIKSASGYVNNLVNDLLDFSQLEAGRMTSEKVPFSLSQLLEETTRTIAADQKKKAIDLILEIDASLNRPILNDPFRIRQIVSNLVGNAYKFTENGKVTVAATLIESSGSKNRVNISITDTGIGISKEKQELIFNEFTQAEHNTVKKYGGYGLGLTISKKLTELLGGTLNLESTLGEGSTFILELPVVFNTKDKPVPKATANTLVQGQIKMLIIDDDPSFLKMIGEMVKTEHIEPIMFNDFNQISTIDSTLNYDLVLTDIEMPTVSGFDVLKQLKSSKYKHYANQPIIAMTGRHDLNKDLFMAHGFSEILKKPFTKNQLLIAIRSLMQHKNLQVTKETNAPQRESNELYSLETLKLFLGDDVNAINEVLHTFLTDTAVNTEQLGKAVTQKNYEQMNKTAHRMLPMFRQLQVTKSISILESLEIAHENSLSIDKVEEGFKHLEKVIHELVAALSQKMAKHPDHIG